MLVIQSQEAEVVIGLSVDYADVVSVEETKILAEIVVASYLVQMMMTVLLLWIWIVTA